MYLGMHLGRYNQNQFISFYEKSRTYLGDETLATLLNKTPIKGEKQEQRERTQVQARSTKTQGGSQRVCCFDASTVITYTQSFPLLRFFYQYM